MLSSQKKNSSEIRICVDFKKTLNKVIDGDHCVLPHPDDIFAKIGDSSCFTVLDLKGAYQQLELSESSKELCTINTHLGLFRFNRLTFGISSAPGIFQSVMETILAGLPKTECYLDDVLVHGSTLEDCHQGVLNVLSRLQEYNVKVNNEKCLFYQESVEFLGHRLDREGVHPTKEKLACIEKIPSPQNVTQLRSYLGLLNYYSKFIPMLSAKLKPLYKLCGHAEFIWNDTLEEVFQNSKKLLTSNDVLTHYNPNLPLIISCDSSGYGVGAVLSHIVNGQEKPIMFASSTLSPTEMKYSNLERESLAIIFALKKFHKFVFGRKFTLLSDHQPLQFIFGKNKGIPVTASARIIRWGVILSAYDYELQYKKGKLLANADGLSRLPIKSSTEIPQSLYSFNLTNESSVDFNEVITATKKDQILVKVIDYTLSGWPESFTDIRLKPFFQKRHDFSVENGCLLRGSKVVIPNSMHNSILQLFHEQHLGIVRTKMLMRSYCWWPSLNEDIEKFIGSCQTCQETQNFSNSSVLLPWPGAPNNFYRCHIDFFHKLGHTFLILIDSKSKYIDVKLMDNGSNARETILKLKEIFAIFGVPVELVSDNGPPFNSSEFNSFCVANGITPIKSPPYHPQSNGSAERAVQTVKKGLERALCYERGEVVSLTSIKNKLFNFLFTYRNTPSTVTGLSPSESLFKMRPRTRFDLIKPTAYKNKSVLHHDLSNHIKLFKINDNVYVKNVQRKLWEKGTVVKAISSVTYLVNIDQNVRLVHANDMRLAPVVLRDISLDNSSPSVNVDSQPSVIEGNSPNVPDDNCNSEPLPNVVNTPNRAATRSEQVVEQSPEHVRASASTNQYASRSGRIIKPPARLNL